MKENPRREHNIAAQPVPRWLYHSAGRANCSGSKQSNAICRRDGACANCSREMRSGRSGSRRRILSRDLDSSGATRQQQHVGTLHSQAMSRAPRKELSWYSTKRSASVLGERATIRLVSPALPPLRAVKIPLIDTLVDQNR
jgi:hypothetical protein